MRQSEGSFEGARSGEPWMTILVESSRRNSISFTTYLFCRLVAACRGHWGDMRSRWYYCNARTPARTVPASHERPRHAQAGRRVSTGSDPQHSRFRCEREASDVAEHSRTYPTSNNDSLFSIPLEWQKSIFAFNYYIIRLSQDLRGWHE